MHRSLDCERRNVMTPVFGKPLRECRLVTRGKKQPAVCNNPRRLILDNYRRFEELNGRFGLESRTDHGRDALDHEGPGRNFVVP
jgi:hypothetical protein